MTCDWTIEENFSTKFYLKWLNWVRIVWSSQFPLILRNPSTEFEFKTMNRWSKFWNFKPLSQTLAFFHGRAFLCNIYILALFLLLRTTEIRKKKCNKRIVKLFRKKRLGHGVCLSQETRSLKCTHLESLSPSTNR